MLLATSPLKHCIRDLSTMSCEQVVIMAILSSESTSKGQRWGKLRTVKAKMGVPPIAGWFIWENPIEMDENWGYPIFGNHDIVLRSCT